MIGQTISHYKILEKLGEGGMGVVYKAQDTKLDRLVALKFLPHHLTANETERARFLQEAKAAAALNHPNVCSVIDIQEHDGQEFIVMEYVDGVTLRKKIPTEKLQDTLMYAVQIGAALAEAHNKGIVHRDVKAENIMVNTKNQVKVMDFGLAKLKGSLRLTKTVNTVGTLAYMAPEQIHGGEADSRSDIFSFGVLLFEMLTGRLPFRGEHEAAMIYSILNEDPQPILSFRSDVPTSFEQVIKKALDKDPSRRYQQVEDLIADLRRSESATQDLFKHEKSISVLPFENISPEKENEYFSDGLTEELIANLSKLKEIQVISRTTSMQYKGTKKDAKTIGRELGVRYILEGSVRKFQDSLRITAQLIDVGTDVHLWAETYKGKLADVFDIQEAVSKQIVDALMVRLSLAERIGLTKRATLNPQAFDLNLRGRNLLYRLTRNDIRTAIEVFEKTTDLDPRYAAAYAGIAEAYATLYQEFERDEGHLDKSIEASLKALMYDATLAEAHASLGLAYFNKGVLTEALEASQKAIDLDPNNFIGYWILGRIQQTLGRDREALSMFDKVGELNPDFYSAIYGYSLMVFERMSDMENYHKRVQQAIEFYPQYLLRNPEDARAQLFYGIDLSRAGRVEQGRIQVTKALEMRPGDPLILYGAACFFSRIDDRTQSLTLLRNAINAGYRNFEWIRRDPDLNNVREEPEFHLLVGQH